MTFPHTFRALNSRNYRLFFAGQGVSLIGNWMTLTTSAWLAYHLSNSAFYVGAVGFCTQIPLLLFAPFTGVWVDRINRRRTFVVLQVAAMLQSVALAVMTFSGHLTIGGLLLLSLWQGLINAWEVPVRQSLLVALVNRREDLPNAIALGSSLYNVARLVAPAVAGLIIAAWGAGVCFALDALTYVPAILALLAVRLPAPRDRRRQAHPLVELREGLAYVRHHPRLRSGLALVPALALFGWTYSILAPVAAREFFAGDARLLGIMLSSIGAGALAGALRLGSRLSPVGLERVVVRAVAVVALAQAVYAVSTWLPLSLAALAAAGFGGVTAMAGNNTWIQSAVVDDKRGRVMGLFAMGQGVFPIGSLLVGALADGIGVRGTLAIAALACAVIAAVFAWLHHRAPDPVGVSHRAVQP